MTTSLRTSNIETAKRFLTAVEAMDGSGLDGFFAPDIKQIEFPNAFKPQGDVRNLAALKVALEKAKGIIDGQHYEVTKTLADETSIMFEMIWTGTMAIDIPPLKAGQNLRANCIAVFDFEDGKVTSLRNYDCFEPFSKG
ncbi:MAG: hypothetical protein CSA72_02840 [Rhodobacterales bacterium]|nr:MAG: hypothetical protein CSA72_02840 [Rhodobacterales bacterium]